VQLNPFPSVTWPRGTPIFLATRSDVRAPGVVLSNSREPMKTL
jgi:hypothetical protein